ncbi:molybdenum hydroxylase accessory protein, YgfJ family [Anopheles sinensis]|uniref:Molybdenum hydroxylase accessory protein, YgfJ family n=1 Tax=Anopheles sinensis TaxID=74873 RepID=A0A084WB08_ANOSI|nr:molybdenum hydroxylase accessory protein, YgfJ family [Anopheles sinensis]
MERENRETRSSYVPRTARLFVCVCVFVTETRVLPQGQPMCTRVGIERSTGMGACGCVLVTTLFVRGSDRDRGLGTLLWDEKRKRSNREQDGVSVLNIVG